MKSARANFAPVGTKNAWSNVSKSYLKKIGFILLLSIFSNLGFAQQKNLNVSDLQQDLSEVTVSIEQLEGKITHIQSRLVGIPPENVDPQLMTRLNDLQIKKDQLEKRKISIQAALNSAQNANDPNDSLNLPESTNSNKENY